MNNKIYLAGPEVFLEDPFEIAKKKKKLCKKYGFTGVFPMDNKVDDFQNTKKTGYLISKMNEELIQSCDYVIANLTPFRGVSADVGTVFEIGYARGLNKVVCGYSNDGTLMIDRVIRHIPTNIDSCGVVRDYMDMAVENFGLSDNLMIEGGIRNSYGYFVAENKSNTFKGLCLFEKCLKFLKRKKEKQDERNREKMGIGMC